MLKLNFHAHGCPIGHEGLVLIPVIGLLFVANKMHITQLYSVSMHLWIDVTYKYFMSHWPDSIFTIIEILSMAIVVVIGIGCYTKYSCWIRKREQPIKLLGLALILVFLYSYPEWIADYQAQKIMSGDGSHTYNITLVPIDNNTSIVPSVPNNDFYLISYENNKFYVKERGRSSPENCKVFIIPDGQVKYAQTG